MEERQRLLVIGAIILFVALAVAVAAGAYRLARPSAGPEAAAVGTAATALPPRIVTNTPTATGTPSPTATPLPSPSPTPTLTPTPSPTPVVVINHVRSLGRLGTTEFAMQTVIDLANAPTNIWEEVFGSDELLLVAEGEVVAGFDLDKVTESDIAVEGGQVEITLPAPEILYSRIDNERTQVYERKTGLFVSPDPTLEGRARQLAEESLVEWALERDILDRAEEAGRLRIENLLRSLGFSDIEIDVKEKEL